MQNQINYAAIGKRIQESRARKKLTQEELASLTDLSTPYISNIENNHTKLSLAALVNIANALNTTPDSLLFDNTAVLYNQYDADIKSLVDDCTQEERKIILATIAQLKKSLRGKP